MASNYVLSFTVLLTIIGLVTSVNYCKLCNGKHTICQRPGCPLSGACASYQQVPLSASDRQVLVNMHNELRNKVAKGQQSPQPSASNMGQMTWDNELAQIAQCWANACQSGHDSCRDTEQFYVGQNVAMRGNSDVNYVKSQQALKDSMQAWYNEVNSFPVSEVASYKGSAGHYSQMVWAKSKKLGCGRVFYKNGRLVSMRLVCNYGPGGNYLNTPVYNRGSPCSQCTRCSSNYSGLCV